MTLYEEIVAKCTPQEIAAGNHHVVAAKVNVGRTKTVKTPIADVQALLQTNGTWWAIKAVAANPAHPAFAAADAVMDVANARYDNIDMSLPIVAQMFGGLVAASVITQAQADELMAMGVQPDPVTYLQCGDAIEKGV